MKWLRAQAASERLTRELDAMAERYLAALQPTATALGDALGLSPESTGIFAEEVIRGSSAAPLAQLVAVLAPKLRQLAGMSSWEVISPASGTAFLEHAKHSHATMRLNCNNLHLAAAVHMQSELADQLRHMYLLQASSHRCCAMQEPGLEQTVSCCV